MSHPRLNWTDIAPKTYKAMAGVNATLSNSTLGPILTDLVQTRVSQINGCAFCLDMHARDLRKHGETWQRINSLSTWRETELYSARERAALNWAETMDPPGRPARSRAGRRLRGAAGRVRRPGNRGVVLGDRRDQRLEPDGHRHERADSRETDRLITAIPFASRERARALSAPFPFKEP